MSEEKVAAYKAEAMEQLAAAGESDIDESIVDERVAALSGMIENRDALYVAGTDPSEIETVRRNFIEKKLGVSDAAQGTAIATAVAEKMSSQRMKNRAAFYYLCQKAV